jgi:hypothetical protein
MVPKRVELLYAGKGSSEAVNQASTRVSTRHARVRAPREIGRLRGSQGVAYISCGQSVDNCI